MHVHAWYVHVLMCAREQRTHSRTCTCTSVSTSASWWWTMMETRPSWQPPRHPRELLYNLYTPCPAAFEALRFRYQRCTHHRAGSCNDVASQAASVPSNMLLVGNLWPDKAK